MKAMLQVVFVVVDESNNALVYYGVIEDLGLVLNWSWFCFVAAGFVQHLMD